MQIANEVDEERIALGIGGRLDAFAAEMSADDIVLQFTKAVACGCDSGLPDRCGNPPGVAGVKSAGETPRGSR